MPKRSKQNRPTWHWYGYEIHGNHQIDNKQILRALPRRRLGRRIDKTTKERLNNAAIALQEKYELPFASCTLFRFIGHNNTFPAFGVVDIVEKGDEHRCTHRAIKGKEIVLASPVILDLYRQLYQRIELLFNQGTPPFERYNDGYLDFFTDPECHELCQQLAEIVPAFKNNILESVEFHSDDETRETAANLLCWTRFDLEDTIAKVSQLLDDPSVGVRNNISRFMLPYVGRIFGAYIKHPLIKNLLVQLDRPSHYDRNKAIYCLLSIAKSSGFLDRQYIKDRGERLIQRIADTSLMPNVRDPALELLALFKS